MTLPHSTTAPAAPATPVRRTRHPLRTTVGVAGELLLTLGVVALLFVAWQLWIGDWIRGAQNDQAGQTLSRQWAQDFHASGPAHAATAPVVLRQPADAQVFGIMHIPRFGSDYAVKIAGGVTRERTLDPIGIGHYPGTPMPGAVGNMALAAHRTTFGKPFNKIADLHVGDPIVIETKDGWYTYRFRNLEYVRPTAGDVTNPVPQTNLAADGRYLTMTSCSPMYSRAERIVAYSVFDSFTPRGASAPFAQKEVG